MTETKRRVYLDWAATTPLCEEAADAMAPFMEPGIPGLAFNANANSLHSEGRKAFLAMENARQDLALCIGARSDEVYFTSGATESDNWAVKGLVQAELERRRQAGAPCASPRVLVSSFEHGAVAAAVESLKGSGVAIDFALPDQNGIVGVESVERALTDDTVLATIMLANNEVGSIQPVRGIAQACHERGCIVHTDAAQALCKMRIDCHELGVDAASFSAHKVCGPKGVGALYVRNGTAIAPLLHGGGQEHHMRSGTQNVAGIVGFAAAVKSLCSGGEALEAEVSRQRGLRDALYRGLCSHECVHPNVPVSEGSQDYLCNVASVSVDGIESETLILRLDIQGFAVSGGSACSSGSLEPSHVLTQLGIPRDRALGALRVSLGRYTTQQDVDEFLEAFAKALDWE